MKRPRFCPPFGLATAALISLLSFGNASAQVLFTALGANTYWATDVSDDGSVVAGFQFGGGQTFRWTATSGAVGIGGNAQANYSFVSTPGISGDGSVVTGTLPIDFGHAFRWTQAGGITDLGAPTDSVGSLARGISRDGKIIIGSVAYTNGAEAFRWDAANGMVKLGTMGGVVSDPLATSANGSTIVGNVTFANHEERAFYWTASGGMVPLTDAASEAYGISSDGSMVVGALLGPNFTSQAFRWTQSEGVVLLGQSTAFRSSGANAISDDGSVIVGNTDGRNGAFIWTPASGMRTLLSVLKNDYGIADQVDGWGRLQASAISPDGRFIVGGGNFEGRSEAWLLDRGLNPLPISTVEPPYVPPPPPELPPVPEPSTYGATGALLLLGLSAWRQRKTKRRVITNGANISGA